VTALEQKALATRLTTATSLLTLERGDLASFQREVDKQTDKSVQYSQRAQSVLQQAWSALLEARKSGVEAELHAKFDFRQLHTPATECSSAAKCVIEIVEFGNTLFQYRFLLDERALVIHDARALRERSVTLLAAARDEPGLLLNHRGCQFDACS
jgi:hypothetical protein